MMFKFASAAALFQVGMGTIVLWSENEHYIQPTSEHCYLYDDPRVQQFGTRNSVTVSETGTFTYVHAADGNLVIQGVQEDCGGWASCITQVSVEFCDLRFKIDLKGDQVWEELLDDEDAQSAQDDAVVLPKDYSVVSFIRNGRNYSVLSLPDNSKIQVNKGSSNTAYGVTVELPDRYNNAVKGLCGFKNSSTLILDDEVFTEYGVTEDADCIANSAYTGEAFGPWGEMADTSYTCPAPTQLEIVPDVDATLEANETTGIVPTTVETDESVEAPANITSGGTPPTVEEQEQARAECLQIVSDAIQAYNNEIQNSPEGEANEICTLDFADAIDDCVNDMLAIKESSVGDIVATQCRAQPTQNETNEQEPPANCHLRRRT